MSDFTKQLTINPETIDTVPPIMVNNWDRKAELETSYDTVIDKMSDGTEQRLGRKIRPHRFEFIRLTSMYQGDLQEMTTFALRACDQVNPTPIYADATAVADEGLGVVSGDFSHTRFFPGGRVVVLELDGCSRVVDQQILTVQVAQDAFLILDSTLTLTGTVLTALPLMDCDLELRSVTQDSMTGRVSSLDLNVNEKINSSALLPLSAPSKEVAFFDDFNTIGLDPLKWPIGSGTIVDGQLVLQTGGAQVISADIDESNFHVIVPYEVDEGGETGSLFNVETTAASVSGYLRVTHFRDPGGSLKARIVIGTTPYFVDIEDSLSGTFEILKFGTIAVFLRSDVILGVYSVPVAQIEKVDLSTLFGAVVARIDSVYVYDSPSRVFLFDPETYEGFPVFTTPHNWADSLQVDFFRDGTRTDFGRGRLVVVDSERPQYQFSMKALMDRQETFDLLRFFDWAKGRLAPFWLRNPQELWVVDSVSSGTVNIKAFRNTPADILDFYRFVWIKATDGTETILQVSDIVVDGDNLAIQTSSTFDSLKTWTTCSSTHLVRFQSDALREVWSNRDVCEVSFRLLELLEPPPVSVDFIWGGLPNTETDEFVFGGFPDTVYSLPGYWGGEP